MMSVKQGVRTWSPAEQVSSQKPDAAQNLGATDRDRALGGENLGDVLNKVADPNYVDPAKLRKVGNDKLDKDAFLKLMLAQMKHQDPTNPMQSHEMAAQLAQFTSLEQLNNINTTLEGMKQAQAPVAGFQALAFIGKRVAGDSSKISRAAGDVGHDVTFQLMGDAAKAKIEIKDAEGNLVRKVEIPNMKKGENSYRWNGLNEDGTAARPGEYKVTIEGVSATGAKVYAKTEFEGKITGVNFSGAGPVLMVGAQSIRLQDAKKIMEDDGRAPAGSAAGAMGGVAAPAAPASLSAPSIEAANGQANAAAARAAYPVAPAKPATPWNAPAPAAPPSAGGATAAKPVPPAEENAPPAEDAPQTGSILTDVAMSREMMTKLANAKP